MNMSGWPRFAEAASVMISTGDREGNKVDPNVDDRSDDGLGSLVKDAASKLGFRSVR